MEKIKLHNKIRMISIEKIRENEFNPNYMDKHLQKSIVEDIKRNGFVGAIVVSPGKKDKFMVIDGAHRFRALKLLKAKEVPCIVIEHDDINARINCIAWNKKRGSFLPRELAEVIADLNKQYRLDDLEQMLGFKQYELKNYLELLKYPKDMESRLEELSKTDIENMPFILSFVLTHDQRETVEKAIALTKEKKRSLAIVEICNRYIK